MSTNELRKEIAAICRMQIDLVKTNGAAFFPGQPLAEVLDLHFILLHLFLADAERRHLSVSQLSREMGLSRDAVRRKLARLVETGWCTNGDHYALSPHHDIGGVLIRSSKNARQPEPAQAQGIVSDIKHQAQDRRQPAAAERFARLLHRQGQSPQTLRNRIQGKRHHAQSFTLTRIITDAGYRGHNAPPDQKFVVFNTGQNPPERGTIRIDPRQ
jgi:hypothetical protein